MPQHAAEIVSYTVDISRTSNNGSFSDGWRRKINLKLNPGRWGANTTLANFYFIDKTEEDIIAIGERNESVITFYVPLRDFVDFYHILQSEKPLVLIWEENVNTPRQSFVQNWRVSTSSQEPLGEGNKEQ